MGINTSRIIIETLVKKALRDIQDSPERSVRNLVDMAQRFSVGKFQKYFFTLVQNILKNENSPYYHLVRETVCRTDHDRILQFGMNMGYNGCTLGARTIRKIEEEEHFNIPWMVFLDICVKDFPEHYKRYEKIIGQGRTLGIYNWAVFCDNFPQASLSLASAYSDCAFLLFAEPEMLTEMFLEEASEFQNLMVMVHYKEGASEVCEKLREMGLLYSVYYAYRTEDEAYITSGDLMAGTEQLHPVFTVLISDVKCSAEARKHIARYVEQARVGQLFRTIPWEMDYDTSYVDGIISEDACLAWFDVDGNLYTLDSYENTKEYNIFYTDLKKILKRAFPKT